MNLFSLSGKLLTSAAPYIAAMDAASKVTDEVADGIADLIKDSVVLSARFQTTANSLAVFTGSLSSAKRELSSLDDLARKTVGLRLESSEKGYQQLRALGFEATRAKGLIKELGEEKILSGADDEALKRVFFNFTQIASGGQKVSQEIRELLTAMPSLKRVFLDAFGSLDPKKIQSFVESNPDQFFDKLIASMAKGKTAAGGFENSVGKLEDAWTEAKRALGEPLLPELTKDVDFFTARLQNNKDTFREWGEYAVDVIQGVKNALGELNDFKAVKQAQDAGATEAGGRLLFSPFYALGDILRPFADSGEKTRNDGAKNQESFKGAKKWLDNNSGEVQAERIAAEEKRIRDEEIARNKEIQNLTTWKNAKDSIYDSFYSTQEAKLSSYLTEGFSEEKKQLNDLASLRADKFRADLTRTQNYYNRLITLANGDKDEIQKLQSDKTEAVTKINADFQKDAYASQRKLAELERSSYSERLQDAIEFKRQMIDELNFNLDINQFNFGESLKSSPFLQRENFDEMIRLTNESYSEVLKITRASYDDQLAEIGLSEEKKTNIRQEAAFAEKRLAEQNRRDIIRIEEDKKNRIAQFYSDIYGAAADFEQQKIQRKTTFLESAFGINNLSLAQMNKTAEIIKSKTSEIDKAQEAYRAADRKRLDAELLSLKQDEYINQRRNSFIKDRTGTVLSLQPDEITKQDTLKQAFKDAAEESANFYSQLESLRGGVSDYYEDFGSFRKLITENLGNETVFDQITAKMLELEKNAALSTLDLKIEQARKLLESPQGKGNQKAQFELDSLLNQRGNLSAEYFRKEQDQRANSITGLREYIGLIKDGDPVVMASIRHAKLADNLKTEAEAFTKLSQQMVYSSEDVKARMVDFLANQPTLTDIIGDFQIGAMQSAFDLVDDGFNKIAESIGIADNAAGKLFTNLFAQLTKLALNKLFQSLFKVNANGEEDNSQQSSGGFWKSILNIGIQALGAAFGAKAGGGSGGISDPGIHRATGGAIYGKGSKTSDSIPIWASNGEFMQQAKAVDYYGLGVMNALNNREIPKEFFGANAFAGGGAISVPTIATQTYSNSYANNKNDNRAYNININMVNNNGGANKGQNWGSQPSELQLKKQLLAAIRQAEQRG